MRLEAVARALARHQEVGQAEEPALEPALERAQRPLAEAETADREVLAERGVGEHDRPLPRGRGQLGEEEPRVAPRAPAGGDRLGLREGERLVAQERVQRRLRHPGRAPARRLGRRRQRRPQGPVGDPQHGRELDDVLGRRGEGQRLDVDQPVRERDLLEEVVDLLVAAEGRESSTTSPRAPGLDRSAGLHLHAPEPRLLGEVAHEPRVGRAEGPSGSTRRSASRRRSRRSRSSANGRTGGGAARSAARRVASTREMIDGSAPEVALAAGPPPRGDRRRRLDARPQGGVRYQRLSDEPERQLARPAVEREVRLVVLRRAGAHLGRGLGEGQRDDARPAQLRLRRRAHLRRPAGCDVLHDRVERAPLLRRVGDLRGAAEHDHAAVVHRVVEARAGEDEAVEEGDGRAGGRARGQRPDHPARRRAVEEEAIAVAQSLN